MNQMLLLMLLTWGTLSQLSHPSQFGTYSSAYVLTGWLSCRICQTLGQTPGAGSTRAGQWLAGRWWRSWVPSSHSWSGQGTTQSRLKECEYQLSYVKSFVVCIVLIHMWFYCILTIYSNWLFDIDSFMSLHPILKKEIAFHVIINSEVKIYIP